MIAAEDQGAALFRKEGDLYFPQAFAAGPWNPGHQSGGAIAGMLAGLIEPHVPDHMMVSRLSVTLLGAGQMAGFTGRVEPFRPGHRIAMIDAELSQDRPFAHARAALTRCAATPPFGCSMQPPSLSLSEACPPLFTSSFSAVLESRCIRRGSTPEEPGAAWFRMAGDLFPGQAPSPLVQAAILSDVGGGLGSVVDRDRWSYANIDIDLHLIRRPEPGWHYLEARTDSAGEGGGMAHMAMYDRLGLYGRTLQTLFIDRRA